MHLHSEAVDEVLQLASDLDLAAQYYVDDDIFVVVKKKENATAAATTTTTTLDNSKSARNKRVEAAGSGSGASSGASIDSNGLSEEEDGDDVDPVKLALVRRYQHLTGAKHVFLDSYDDIVQQRGLPSKVGSH